MLKILVGSHNYGLNTDTSDKDYKIFISPTFEDLYYNKKLSKVEKTETEDIEYKDIRTLPDLLKDSHPNSLELLFSKEIESPNSYAELYEKLKSMRDDIVKANINNLISSTTGNIRSLLKSIPILKDNRTAKHTKLLKTALRLDNMLFLLGQNKFNNFEQILKNGITLEQINNKAEHFLNYRPSYIDFKTRYTNYYESYVDFEIDIKTNNAVDRLVRNFIRQDWNN